MMLEIKEIKKILKSMLNKKRYLHSLNTAEMAEKLAERHGADRHKAYLAGLVHDCAKNLNSTELISTAEKYKIDADSITLLSPYLLHGAVGAYIAKEKFEIDDPEILSAVTYHTMGKVDMTLIEKIVFLADVIELSRTYKNIESIRKEAFNNLDKALIMAYDGIIRYVLKQDKLLHQDTVEARNYLILHHLEPIIKQPY